MTAVTCITDAPYSRSTLDSALRHARCSLAAACVVFTTFVLLKFNSARAARITQQRMPIFAHRDPCRVDKEGLWRAVRSTATAVLTSARTNNTNTTSYGIVSHSIAEGVADVAAHNHSADLTSFGVHDCIPRRALLNAHR